MYQQPGAQPEQGATDGQTEEPKTESDSQVDGEKKTEEPVEGEVVE